MHLKKYLDFYHSMLNTKNKSVRANFVDAPSIHTLSRQHATMLHEDIRQANRLLSSYKRLREIPWKVIFLKSALKVENNFPHTHYDTIFLFDTFFDKDATHRISLLIHEKIHIYQRFFTIPFHKILLDYYKLNVNSLLYTHPDFDKVRMNPDNNLLIYDDQGTYVLPLLQNNPKSLHDVVNTQYGRNVTNSPYAQLSANEHPNETLAYFLTNKIVHREALPADVARFL